MRFFEELLVLYKNNSLGKKIIQGGAGSFVVQVSSQIIALIYGIVLARMLGASDYGIYSYAFSLLTVFLVGARLGIPTLLIREVSYNDSLQQWSKLKGVIVRGSQGVIFFSFTVLVLAGLVFLLLKSNMPSSQYLTFMLMLILIPLMSLTDVTASSLKGLEHVVKSEILYQLVRPVLVLILLIVFFWFLSCERTPELVIVFQIIASLIVLFLGIYLLYKYLPHQISSVQPVYETKKWLKSAFPLALIAGAGIINNKTDIIMLGMLSSSADVGVYNVAVKASGLVSFSLTAVNAVIAPQFSRLYANGEKEKLQKIVTFSSRLIFFLSLPAAVLLIIWGGELASLVFGSEYDRSGNALAILSFGQLINASMGSVGFLLNMTGYEKYTARTMIGTAILNIVLNIFLIPLFGILGAAISTMVSISLWNFILMKVARQKLGIDSTAFKLK